MATFKIYFLCSVYSTMRKYNPKYSKKTYKKKYKKSNPTRTLTVRGGQPFPMSTITTLKYCAYKYIDPQIGGGCAIKLFRCNGIYDPDVDVGGGQPLGRDQWAAVYQHYTVVSSKCTAHFESLADSGTSYCPTINGIYVSDDATLTASTWTDLCEQRQTKWIVTQGVSSAQGKRTVTMKYNPVKQYGTRNPRDRDDLCALIGADPAEQTYFMVFAGSMDQNSDTIGVRVAIVLTYKVLFYEPAELPAS